MSSSEIELPTMEAVRRSRFELADAIRENFAKKLGAKATMIGSLKKGHWDVFSDVDIWISIPDDAMEAAVQTRVDSFSSVGDTLLRWERPSFAPLNGLHSIVLYDSDEVAPIEVDYYLAPESMDSYYAGFINCEQSRAKDYQWARGEDDDSPFARVDYGSLVALWAGKYWFRDYDRPQQLDWARNRFKAIADELGIGGDVDLSGDVSDLSKITEAYRLYATKNLDVRRMRACEKIIDTLHLIEKVEN